MEELDCDNKSLNSNNKKPAFRDVVQFVPYKEFNFNPVLLAAETLKELPK